MTCRVAETYSPFGQSASNPMSVHTNLHAPTHMYFTVLKIEFKNIVHLSACSQVFL